MVVSSVFNWLLVVRLVVAISFIVEVLNVDEWGSLTWLKELHGVDTVIIRFVGVSLDIVSVHSFCSWWRIKAHPSSTCSNCCRKTLWSIRHRFGRLASVTICALRQLLFESFDPLERHIGYHFPRWVSLHYLFLKHLQFLLELRVINLFFLLIRWLRVSVGCILHLEVFVKKAELLLFTLVFVEQLVAICVVNWALTR